MSVCLHANVSICLFFFQCILRCIHVSLPLLYYFKLHIIVSEKVYLCFVIPRYPFSKALLFIQVGSDELQSSCNKTGFYEVEFVEVGDHTGHSCSDSSGLRSYSHLSPQHSHSFQHRFRHSFRTVFFFT